MTFAQPVVDPPAYGPQARTRRPLPALVAAAGVVVTYLVLQLVEVMAGSLYNWTSSRFSETPLQLFTIAISSVKLDLLPAIVILIVGFLFFWGAAPIHATLCLGQAIGRGVLAALASGIVAGIALTIQYLVILNSPPLSNYGSPSKHDLMRGVAEASVQGVQSFVQTATFVVLGAIILWNWMRLHPVSRHDTTAAARV